MFSLHSAPSPAHTWLTIECGSSTSWEPTSVQAPLAWRVILPATMGPGHPSFHKWVQSW